MKPGLPKAVPADIYGTESPEGVPPPRTNGRRGRGGELEPGMARSGRDFLVFEREDCFIALLPSSLISSGVLTLPALVVNSERTNVRHDRNSPSLSTSLYKSLYQPVQDSPPACTSLSTSLYKHPVLPHVPLLLAAVARGNMSDRPQADRADRRHHPLLSGSPTKRRKQNNVSIIGIKSRRKESAKRVCNVIARWKWKEGITIKGLAGSQGNDLWRQSTFEELMCSVIPEVSACVVH
ncbi:unnamed protein product [Timema podura]|uniref:Uncharacterized protein n=1 Tax=Timema podura TaxID=61482 RepID=A0ABN7NXC6_TIMPD|nr:unnamed protein product [Timema podura]